MVPKRLRQGEFPCSSREPFVTKIAVTRSGPGVRPSPRSPAGSMRSNCSLLRGDARAETLSKSMTLEETCVQSLFEFPNLMTDGGPGHAEFPRRAGEREVATGSLEGPQGIERRERARRYMNFSHDWGDQSSLVKCHGKPQITSRTRAWFPTIPDKENRHAYQKNHS